MVRRPFISTYISVSSALTSYNRLILGITSIENRLPSSEIKPVADISVAHVVSCLALHFIFNWRDLLVLKQSSLDKDKIQQWKLGILSIHTQPSSHRPTDTSWWQIDRQIETFIGKLHFQNKGKVRYVLLAFYIVPIIFYCFSQIQTLHILLGYIKKNLILFKRNLPQKIIE